MKDTLSTNSPSKKWFLYLASGAISGTVSRTMTAPLDRFRLLIQMAPQKVKFHQVVKKSLRENSIKALWRGNMINVLKVGPEISIKFGTYQEIKNRLSHENEKLSTKNKLISAGSAGMLSQMIVYPMDTLKTRMTIRRRGQYKGIFGAIRKIYTSEGVGAFYRGYKAALLGIIPYASIDLVTFDSLKEKFVYQNPSNSESINMAKVACCGTVSTLFAHLFAYPLFLVKSRQQGISRHVSIAKVKKCGICETIQILVQTDGPIGLYRGLIPTLSKSIPAGAINYMMFEICQNFLQHHFT